MLNINTFIAKGIDFFGKKENITNPDAIEFYFTEGAAMKLQSALNWLNENDNGDQVRFNGLLKYELLEKRGEYIDNENSEPFRSMSEMDFEIFDCYIGITKQGHLFAELETDEGLLACDLCNLSKIYSPQINLSLQSKTL